MDVDDLKRSKLDVAAPKQPSTLALVQSDQQQNVLGFVQDNSSARSVGAQHSGLGMESDMPPGLDEQRRPSPGGGAQQSVPAPVPQQPQRVLAPDHAADGDEEDEYIVEPLAFFTMEEYRKWNLDVRNENISQLLDGRSENMRRGATS